MLETDIVMSSLIFRLILILMFYLAFTLMLRLILLHGLLLSSLIDVTIAHMVLVHERTALSLDALITTHVLVVVIISRVGLVFLLDGSILTLSRDTWMVHVFPRRGSRPTRPSGEVQMTMKTSSDRMVKCWISKIYPLTLALSHRPFLIQCR
jgi:hypothetical protein